MMGMMLPIFSIPVLSLALVVAAAAGRRLTSGLRRAAMVAAILLACATFTLIRTGGMSGDGASDLHWRWAPAPQQDHLSPTPTEPEPPAPAAAAAPDTRLPATTIGQPAAPTSSPAAAKIPEKGGANPVAANTAANWPGFRGPERDGVIRGVRIDTDWAKS